MFKTAYGNWLPFAILHQFKTLGSIGICHGLSWARILCCILDGFMCFSASSRGHNYPVSLGKNTVLWLAVWQAYFVQEIRQFVVIIPLIMPHISFVVYSNIGYILLEILCIYIILVFLYQQQKLLLSVLPVLKMHVSTMWIGMWCFWLVFPHTGKRM